MRALVAALAVLVLTICPAGDTAARGSGPPGRSAAASLPGRLVATWSAPARVPIQAFQTGPYAFTPGTVVLPGDEEAAAELHDPLTGVIRARIPALPGHFVTDVGFAGNVMVLALEADGSEDRLLVGYEPRSARELWRTPVPAATGPDGGTVISSSVLITRGAVIVVTSDDRRLAGFDPATGRRLWERAVQAGCMTRVEAGALLAILRDCGKRGVRLTAVDVRTGRTAWLSDIPVYGADSTPLWFVVAPGGEIMVTVSGTYHVYDPGGRHLLEGRDQTGQTFGVSGDTMTVTYSELGHGAYTSTTSAFDRRTGRPLWTRPKEGVWGRADHDDLLPAPGLLVGRTSWDDTYSDWPMPYFVSVIGKADGTMRDLPVPVDDASAELMGTSGDLVFVHHESAHGMRVTAYRLLPATSGGAWQSGGLPPSSWPDACSLLSAADLAALGHGYRARPRGRDLRGLALRDPVRCDLVSSAEDVRPVSLTIDWVARTEAEATGLFESALYYRGRLMPPVKRLAPRVFQVGKSSVEGPPDTALIQAGSVIARLTVHGSTGGMRRIAPIVERNMRERVGERTFS